LAKWKRRKNNRPERNFLSTLVKAFGGRSGEATRNAKPDVPGMKHHAGNETECQADTGSGSVCIF